MLLVLSSALAIHQADSSLVGAVAPALKAHLHLSNSRIGLLASVGSLVGTACCLPMGVLTDRTRRVRLLSVVLVVWSLAMFVTGAAVSFTMLVVTRLWLGGAAAGARPVTVSLVGDTYPASFRGRVMAIIDGFQTAGTGIGYVVAGLCVTLLSWRWAFWTLGLLGASLVIRSWRLTEPPRGRAEEPDLVASGTEGKGITLRGDQSHLPLREVVAYLLHIRTNVAILVADAVGTFFFAGVSTFAVLYLTQQYGLSTGAVDLAMPVMAVGVLAGTFVGGSLADRAMTRHDPASRITVATVAYVCAAVLLLPAILTRNVLIGGPLLVIGAGCQTASNPVLDAVRIDIVHPQIRGRAESVRGLLSVGSGALAPLAFGVASSHIAGGGHRGLQDTFLLMLVALAANGLVLLFARAHYPEEASAVAQSVT